MKSHRSIAGGSGFGWAPLAALLAVGCRAASPPSPDHGVAAKSEPSRSVPALPPEPPSEPSVPPGACDTPSHPWILRSVLGSDLLQVIEQPGPAACEVTVAGTVRRIRNSLYFDGPAEERPSEEPEELCSWRTAPVLLWPTLAFATKNPLNGWSSVVPGNEAAGVPHMVVWSEGLSSSDTFGSPRTGESDYLLAIDETTLKTRPLFKGRPKERLRLLGRWESRALLLGEFGGKLEAIFVDGKGQVTRSGPTLASSKSLQYSHAELTSDVYEPIGPQQAALVLDELYVLTISNGVAAFEPTGRQGKSIVRRGEHPYFGLSEGGGCLDLGAVPPNEWKSAPSTPCPEGLEDAPWYEHPPLPVDGQRKPFVAKVAGCQVRTGLRLGKKDHEEDESEDEAGPYRPEAEPDQQLLKVRLNQTAFDDGVELDVHFRVGPAHQERLQFGIGRSLPRYHDRSLVWRLSIPPQAIVATKKGGAEHQVKLRYPGFIGPWPNDCHEGSFLVRAGTAFLPYSLMWGYCE